MSLNLHFAVLLRIIADKVVYLFKLKFELITTKANTHEISSMQCNGNGNGNGNSEKNTKNGTTIAIADHDVLTTEFNYKNF